jgi:hypothetical protein
MVGAEKVMEVTAGAAKEEAMAGAETGEGWAEAKTVAAMVGVVTGAEARAAEARGAECTVGTRGAGAREAEGMAEVATAVAAKEAATAKESGHTAHRRGSSIRAHKYRSRG